MLFEDVFKKYNRQADDLLGIPKFPLGEIEITESVEPLVRQGLLLDLYLDRHWRGDWGEADFENTISNLESIVLGKGGEVISHYQTPFGPIWIFTDVGPTADGAPAAFDSSCVGSTCVYTEGEF
jgi:hypothetical protein